ncbi:MAG: Lrp/AsnC family transcriptional regulator [Oscillospiraceae bacterium]|nr:Lrp/AsnC family transcriptional regulator [Oscillospiraceae bacterium]
MDKIDKKLISLLLENARHPLKYLAEAVYLSSPAVSARLERLEKNGVLTGYSARIDPLKLGYHIKAYIHLELPPEQKPVFIPYIRSCKNVLECDCVTGSYSMLIKVCFPSTAALDQFIGELQQFGRTQTQIVLSTAVPAREVSLDALEEE